MPTILIIEEEEIIRGLMRAILEGGGYQVVEARDGKAGYVLAQCGGVDAIILDCMGRMSDGIGVLRRLRGDALTAHLPVIALCGLGQSGAEIGLWANALLVKPFRPAQLLLKVQLTLSARIEASRAGDPLRTGALA